MCYCTYSSLMCSHSWFCRILLSALNVFDQTLPRESWKYLKMNIIYSNGILDRKTWRLWLNFIYCYSFIALSTPYLLWVSVVLSKTWCLWTLNFWVINESKPYCQWLLLWTSALDVELLRPALSSGLHGYMSFFVSSDPWKLTCSWQHFWTLFKSASVSGPYRNGIGLKGSLISVLYTLYLSCWTEKQRPLVINPRVRTFDDIYGVIGEIWVGKSV